jgi:preprotein translocase subunit Sss1
MIVVITGVNVNAIGVVGYISCLEYFLEPILMALDLINIK